MEKKKHGCMCVCECVLKMKKMSVNLCVSFFGDFEKIDVSSYFFSVFFLCFNFCFPIKLVRKL